MQNGFVEELGEEMKLGMRLNNQLAYKLHF